MGQGAGKHRGSPRPASARAACNHKHMGGPSRWLLRLRGRAPSSSLIGDAGARTVAAKRVWWTGEAAESDIAFCIGKEEAELTLQVNNAAFYNDLH